MPDDLIDLLVVTPSGQVWDHSVTPDETGRVSTRAVLEMLYDLIGCTAVDVVRLSPEFDMWIDDEGALKPQVRVNQLTSYIATRFGYPFQLYLGVAVFSGGVNDEGDTMSLSKPARDTLLALIDELRSIRWGR
jgi:hypothetical protein